MFHIFYGGEPLLRKDLYAIVDYCNKENIHYTIISNNTPAVKSTIYDLLRYHSVKGFSGSCDPVIEFPAATDSDRKSLEALQSLGEYKRFCPDVVAEITIMQHNQHLLYEHVKQLSENGISSSITFIDVAKNPYYDFSNVRDESLLVSPNAILAKQFQSLMDDSSLNIHMKEQLLPLIWLILPSNLDCKIDKNLHNITVDADGSLRLCLRIRGVAVPAYTLNERTFFAKNFDILPEVMEAVAQDKQNYCKLCNHTCQLMSALVDGNEKLKDSLIHTEIRNDFT
jgi:MoaA/NifB/PqqE/SkfB family radical SAM enzyme